MAENALAKEICDAGSQLNEWLGALAGSPVVGALVVGSGMVKPDLLLELASGASLRATVKSSQSENGTTGHAGRLKVGDLSGMGFDALAIGCMSLIGTQEYAYAALEKREEAKRGALLVPAKRLARLALMGACAEAPELALIHLGQGSARVLAGPTSILFDLAPELGVDFKEPRVGGTYASAGFGCGLFSVKRSGGTSGNDLHVTVSSAVAKKLYEEGRLLGWGEARMGQRAKPRM
jgi:hypothetical protein